MPQCTWVDGIVGKERNETLVPALGYLTLLGAALQPAMDYSTPFHKCAHGLATPITELLYDMMCLTARATVGIAKHPRSYI
mmetsp:Transcript_18360/g.41623  ORF Transcript_18360/g.41623 Transcript_18360/m.41623 type:complete len:81 (-) Transcript_18360:1176-1418(-)